MLSHFSAMLLFALFTSVVFGITQRAEPKMMIRFGAFCFSLFVGATIIASWAMWVVKH
jgi:flagellar biosynthesis protein FliR